VAALLAAAGAVLAVIVVGVVVWLAVSALGGSDDEDRLNDDVSNVLEVFTGGADGGAVTRRYEGRLPPGFPDAVPTYPGADVVASIVQVNGEDAGFLVVYDTGDDREDVTAYFEEQLSTDPWQIDAGQAGRTGTRHQFSRIDEADVGSVVISAASPDADVTTIIVTFEVVSGADSVGDVSFEPPATQVLPEGFPTDIPQYPDSILIESAFGRQPQGDAFVVSYITEDGIDDVLAFFNEEFGERGWTVEEADAGESPLEDAQAISFSEEDGVITGEVSAGVFTEDEGFTRFDVQVASTE
jgi:hypothetical protein